MYGNYHTCMCLCIYIYINIHTHTCTKICIRTYEQGTTWRRVCMLRFNGIISAWFSRDCKCKGFVPRTPYDAHCAAFPIGQTLQCFEVPASHLLHNVGMRCSSPNCCPSLCPIWPICSIVFAMRTLKTNQNCP